MSGHRGGGGGGSYSVFVRVRGEVLRRAERRSSSRVFPDKVSQHNSEFKNKTVVKFEWYLPSSIFITYCL